MLNKDLVKYIRQLTKDDKKTLSQKALKAAEEVGELAKVVLPYDNAHGTTHRFVQSNKILEEVCDTILTAVSIAYELEFTDEEVEQMLLKKANKWADVQSRSSRVKYPIPYEIHITVDMKRDRLGQAGPNVEDFKIDCDLLKVKPILLDLHLNGKEPIKDMMTSSVHIGNNRSAFEEMKRIVNGLTDLDYKVIREKIETVPWHPAAPSIKHEKPIMPPHCYFECHFNIITPIARVGELDELAKRLHFHKSRNILKKITDDVVTTMVTHRRPRSPYEDVRHDIDNFKKKFEENGFEIEKEIIEFSIYDSKVSHDATWITGDQ